jgi:hypothetical protein
MTYEEQLIKVYVPDAQMMSFEDAVKLAHERDEKAAAELEATFQSQLRLKEAARIVNESMEIEFTARETQILKELGFEVI